MAEATTIAAAASGVSGATSLGPASGSHPNGNADASSNANASEKGQPPSRHRSRGRGRGEGNGRGGRGGGGRSESGGGRGGGRGRGRGGRRGQVGRGGRGKKNDSGNSNDNEDGDANVNGTGSGEAAKTNGAETSRISADDANSNRGNRGTRRNRRGGGRRSSNNGEKDRSNNSNNDNGSREASEEHALQFIADSLPPNPSDSAIKNNNLKNNHESSTENAVEKPPPTSQKRTQQRNKRRRNKQKQKYPWRKFIPEGAVDPISLDPLDELPYPPFALVVDEPYVPVFPGEWPPVPVNGDGKEELTAAASTAAGNAMAASGSDGEGASSRRKQQETEEERKKREMEILKQQWGESATSTSYLTLLSKKKEPSEETNTRDDDNNNNNENNSGTHITKPTSNQTPPLQNRVFNLFDPHILSNYLISTLQFIDPLNRRDLTRPELQALDAHLRTYRLGKPHVVEAYDEKGVTVSAAGSRAQTTSGRAEILQQEARNILAGFFRGERPRYARGSEGHGSRPSQEQQQQQQQETERDDGVTNDFQRMYMAQEGRNRRRRQDNSTAMTNGRDHDHGQNADTGIYGNESGLVMIDDDINPGLRSGVPSDDRNRNGSYTQSTHSNLGSLYSARHITERYSQEAQIRDTNFPSLSAAASSSANAVNSDPNATTSANNTAKKAAPPVSGPPSKSLLKITNVVKKTDPAEVARQKKAREEAQRKAAMTQLNYFDPSTANSTLLTAPTPMQRLPPSEAILERNRNLAMALGVAPSTIRNDVSLTGWARPTTVEIQLDQFGNELNTAQYPDSLLAQAKERMTELLKVEKIWKKFLADDREASCSLRPMDRPLRKFIHEYSDFWKLHTQSFDPEGKRYIHCGKLMDTAMPYPLLSEAVKKWRGPAPGSLLPPVPMQTTTQTPNQPQAKSQSQSQPQTQTQPANTEGWATEQRIPLKLTPRTIAEGAPPPPPSSGGMTRSSSTPFLSMTGEKPPPPRFADLHEKERPKLQLAPRTIPVEGGGGEYPQQQREEDMEAKKRELARMQRRENKAKKERANMEKKRAILESAFASDDDDDDGDGGGSIGASSSSSDWFEGDAAFDASDDEGLL